MTDKNRCNIVTENMVKYCYTCNDAHKCDTEEKCIKCWEDKGIIKKGELDQEVTTKKLLEQYAL